MLRLKLGPGQPVIENPTKEDWAKYKELQAKRLEEREKKEKRKIEREAAKNQDWLESGSSGSENEDDDDEDWTLEPKKCAPSKKNRGEPEKETESEEDEGSDVEENEDINNNVEVGISRKEFQHLDYDASKCVREAERTEQRRYHRELQKKKISERELRARKSVAEREEEMLKANQKKQDKAAKRPQPGGKKKRGPYRKYARETMEEAVEECKRREKVWQERQGDGVEIDEEDSLQNAPDEVKCGFYAVAKEFEVPVQTLWEHVRLHRRTESGRYVKSKC